MSFMTDRCENEDLEKKLTKCHLKIKKLGKGVRKYAGKLRREKRFKMARLPKESGINAIFGCEKFTTIEKQLREKIETKEKLLPIEKLILTRLCISYCFGKWRRPCFIQNITLADYLDRVKQFDIVFSTFDKSKSITPGGINVKEFSYWIDQYVNIVRPKRYAKYHIYLAVSTMFIIMKHPF
jgi:hypothetical protein